MCWTVRLGTLFIIHGLRAGATAVLAFFLSCSFQFFKDWKEWVQLLYLDIQIVPAVRTVHLWLNVAGGIVGHQFADGDA